MQGETAHAQFGIPTNYYGMVDMSRVPVLAILGSTGCGKSRLSIELARRFFGEIISADSMQVYKSLDIITAKVTKEERQMAPHHMLDIVDPLSLNFTVMQFRDMTLPIIDDLLTREKLPIIVGGTNYYIEALLWNILMDHDDKSTPNNSPTRDSPDGGNKISESSRENKNDSISPKKMKFEIDRDTTESNEELFTKLKKADPEMAKRIHPNNRRKIIR
ncbi:tRNA dimethylallyltransferase, mitochondrial [Dufourea novaeangliae]|uniref:tRNA dimethylallyltransferase, mitochondrial n=1 Tax=Dufourea novaeangliae TaxID=178035 RepID=A0A154PPN5_DUFNO|nr:tRNA dimethylallyltransferase, mitochondrial [Dufourea novaeangliae]